MQYRMTDILLHVFIGVFLTKSCKDLIYVI